MTHPRTWWPRFIAPTIARQQADRLAAAATAFAAHVAALHLLDRGGDA